jgi:hypothetical protein
VVELPAYGSSTRRFVHSIGLREKGDARRASIRLRREKSSRAEWEGKFQHRSSNFFTNPR